mmetsp:Transcript_8190/g.21756  ORF Transcript_8190/g.21756 Transcript_8190/m.21756 type:complete len:179 (-) Transcript_8190:651-1187(-)
MSSRGQACFPNSHICTGRLAAAMLTGSSDSDTRFSSPATGHSSAGGMTMEELEHPEHYPRAHYVEETSPLQGAPSGTSSSEPEIGNLFLEAEALLLEKANQHKLWTSQIKQLEEERACYMTMFQRLSQLLDGVDASEQGDVFLARELKEIVEAFYTHKDVHVWRFGGDQSEIKGLHSP